MDTIGPALSQVAAEHRFSGVVRVDRAGHTELAEAFGLAERGLQVPNTVNGQFGMASATKGLTALAVISLVNEGRLSLDTSARSLLGEDLPEIDDRVTVEHLLAHRSGIGDYIDEDTDFDASDYLMPVPVHQLANTEGYLPALEGHRSKFSPGDRFSYCNSGYVVLALIAERVSGMSFHDLVASTVCRPAGMRDTDFLRSDELPGRAARGYLEADGLQTNVLHLPVRGSGDGGAYSTVGDIHRLWQALFLGHIVPEPWVADMVRPRSEVPDESLRYGLGFWLAAAGDAVRLEGYDAGVSFRSVHDPSTQLTWTVVSNTSEGAWPVAGFLTEVLHER